MRDDEAGDPAHAVAVYTVTDCVHLQRPARLRDMLENRGARDGPGDRTVQGIGLSARQSEVEATLGVPFGDGVDGAAGWYVLQYEGPFVNTWIVFAYPDGNRSRMVRFEVFGPTCP